MQENNKDPCEGVVEVFVPLLNEGTRVLRSAPAIRRDKTRFELVPPEVYDPSDERWEFPPGSVVECRVEDSGRGAILVAFARSAES